MGLRELLAARWVGDRSMGGRGRRDGGVTEET